MELYNVIDSSMDVVRVNKYDLALFACGYEERCTAIPRELKKENICIPIVIGFSEDASGEQRTINEKYFKDHWSLDVEISSSDDEQKVYDILNSVLDLKIDSIRILVDYSSMSRLWFAGVLNWAKYVKGPNNIYIDMLYAPGLHKEKVSPMVINKILSIPGCEGSATALFKTIAIFGLGFDSHAVLCILDRLEPDFYYTYLAAPTIFDDYPKFVYKVNSELISGAKQTLELPLFSVEQTFVSLAEIVSIHKNEADIVFVPMGPKPHVLASILLSMKFGEVTCLRVSTLNSSQYNIKSSGHVISTTIVFKPELNK